MKVDEIIKGLRKKYGEGSIFRGSEVDLSVDKVLTGVLSLDVAIEGGFPRGRIIELAGVVSGGKSWLASRVAVEIQKLKEQVVWIDMEQSCEREWLEAIGVDVDKLLIVRPDSGNAAIDMLEAFIRADGVGLVVLDSLAALSSLLELDESAEKEQMGVQARLVNKAIRKCHSALNQWKEGKPNQTMVILINQVRQNIGGWGASEVYPGGMGKDFAASLILRIGKSKVLSRHSVKVIQVSNFNVKKSKVSKPFEENEFAFVLKDANKSGDIWTAGKVDNVDGCWKYIEEMLDGEKEVSIGSKKYDLDGVWNELHSYDEGKGSKKFYKGFVEFLMQREREWTL